jgi:hypothetical protein
MVGALDLESSFGVRPEIAASLGDAPAAAARATPVGQPPQHGDRRTTRQKQDPGIVAGRPPDGSGSSLEVASAPPHKGVSILGSLGHLLGKVADHLPGATGHCGSRSRDAHVLTPAAARLVPIMRPAVIHHPGHEIHPFMFDFEATTNTFAECFMSDHEKPKQNDVQHATVLL